MFFKRHIPDGAVEKQTTPRVLLTRRWRTSKAMIVLFCLEFGLTIATLALFGIADPDLYRTRLWEDGAENGFNSSPEEVLFAGDNGKTIKTPLVWSQFITNYNLVISVLSMFILLVKSVLFVMHILYPLVSTAIHALLVALYAVSLHAQLSPDMSDPLHPQPGAPWYITKPCSVVHNADNLNYCKQAKASFAVTVIMTGLFTIYLLLSILSAIPSKTEKNARAADEERGKIQMYTPEPAKRSHSQTAMSSQQWGERLAQGYLSMPRTPGTAGGMKSPMTASSSAPMIPLATPRTVAFQTLDGALAKPKSSGLGKSPEVRSLPFRQQYGGPDGR